MSDRRLDANTASNYSITPELSFYVTKTRVEFNGSCLKKDEVSYNYGTIVNIYIVYEISKNYNISSYPTLENSLTKNPDIDQYKYSGYDIGFDRHGADLISSVHANNKKNIFLYSVKISHKE